MPVTLQQLEDLIGKVPDPSADRAALIALQGAEPAVRRLAAQLHRQEALRQLPLRELLPGLSIVDSTLFPHQFGTRAAKALLRNEVRSWADLGELTPERLTSLAGVETAGVEDILLAALKEWAVAYLSATRSSRDEVPLPRDRREQLLELIGKAPNPLADGELLLALRASEHDDSKLLAETLLDDEELQRLSLRRLLPGLGLVESPTFAVELSVRAANGLGRAGSISLDTLAELTPSEIRELPNVGGKAAEELVRAALREWAESYLRSVDREPRPVTPTALAQQDRDRQIDTADLAKAFEEVEAIAGFDVFRRRFLDPDRPSQSTVALEFGVSGSRISQRERGVKAKLSKRLRDSHWPITRAVKTMQDRLGSVALSNELAEAIAGLDPTGRIVSDEHRKALLARLGGYRISGQWALGPDIESLTSAVLSGLIEDGPVDVDFVREPLVRLGIRELLHLPWIISRPGFQIVDGKLKRAETD